MLKVHKGSSFIARDKSIGKIADGSMIAASWQLESDTNHMRKSLKIILGTRRWENIDDDVTVFQFFQFLFSHYK